MKTSISVFALFALGLFPAATQAASNDAGAWDSKAAAAYLDQEADRANGELMSA